MTLAHENAIKAGVFTHPSRLKVPDDFNALLEKSNVPVLFNTCEVDNAFPAESQAKADEFLGGGKYKPGYQRTYWPGCTHGFAVRGDMVSYWLQMSFLPSYTLSPVETGNQSRQGGRFQGDGGILHGECLISHPLELRSSLRGTTIDL